MSLELTGVHGLLKRHKLFTHKYIISRVEFIKSKNLMIIRFIFLSPYPFLNYINLSVCIQL